MIETIVTYGLYGGVAIWMLLLAYMEAKQPGMRM